MGILGRADVSDVLEREDLSFVSRQEQV